VKESTRRFFDLIARPKQNFVETEKKVQEIRTVGEDQFRNDRDAARRERLGQLRARPHPNKRQRHATPVWDTLPDTSF
jgi:hypothetical protein